MNRQPVWRWTATPFLPGSTCTQPDSLGRPFLSPLLWSLPGTETLGSPCLCPSLAGEPWETNPDLLSPGVEEGSTRRVCREASSPLARSLRERRRGPPRLPDGPPGPRGDPGPLRFSVTLPARVGSPPALSVLVYTERVLADPVARLLPYPGAGFAPIFPGGWPLESPAHVPDVKPLGGSSQGNLTRLMSRGVATSNCA